MVKGHFLTLYQEVLLLALHDEKGTAAFGSMYGLGLGGAMLAELLFAGRVEVTEEGRHGLVTPRDPRGTGDPILDECLARVRSAKRRASPSTWISRFAGMRDLRNRVARSLVDRGVLREAEDRVLLVFTRRTYPTLDPAAEGALVERLRAAIFTDAAPDERTAVLVALASVTGLLDPVFGKKELKPRKERIRSISSSAAVGRATRQAMEAVHAAVIAATTAATVSAAT